MTRWTFSPSPDLLSEDRHTPSALSWSTIRLSFVPMCLRYISHHTVHVISSTFTYTARARLKFHLPLSTVELWVLSHRLNFLRRLTHPSTCTPAHLCFSVPAPSCVAWCRWGVYISSLSDRSVHSPTDSHLSDAPIYPTGTAFPVRGSVSVHSMIHHTFYYSKAYTVKAIVSCFLSNYCQLPNTFGV